jgi:hypothetical protein
VDDATAQGRCRGTRGLREPDHPVSTWVTTRMVRIFLTSARRLQSNTRIKGSGVLHFTHTATPTPGLGAGCAGARTPHSTPTKEGRRREPTEMFPILYGPGNDIERRPSSHPKQPIREGVSLNPNALRYNRARLSASLEGGSRSSARLVLSVRCRSE